jgi:hypothetical protein
MSASIQDISKKLKAFISDDRYFYTLLIITVSFLSFGLGRMSVQESQSNQQPKVVMTEQLSAVARSATNSSTTTLKKEVIKNFVASKKGTKYHLLSCPGAKQMSEKNKIYFDSEAKAKAAGYIRAKNCKF